MKSSVSAQLTDYLLSHDTVPFVADLFVIRLQNGYNITATSGQLDILNVGAPAMNYYATLYGKWSRGAITSEAAPGLAQSNSMTLTFVDNNSEENGSVIMPGTSATILQAVASKLFQGAGLSVFTAYMPTYGDVSLGLETKFVGDIIKVEALDRTHVEFTVYDLLWRLNQQCPPNLYQAPCRHTLFNSNCTLSSASFQVSGTVASGSTNSLINVNSALGSVGNDPLPYTLGVLKWTGGNNLGLSNTVKTQVSTTQLQFDVPTFLPVQTGDTFNLLPGCNKTLATCENKYNNLINFGGIPYAPVAETTL